MRSVVPVLTVLAAIVALWYIACAPMNIHTAVTEAERAVLVSVEGPDSSGKLKVHALAASGFSARDLAGAEGAVSRTVVERCIADGRAVLTTQNEDKNLIHASTLVRRGVLSGKAPSTEKSI